MKLFSSARARRALLALLCLLATALAACSPSPAPPPAAAVSHPGTRPTAALEWSPVVNGLRARILSISLGGNVDSIFLELQNSGSRPLTISSLRVGPTSDFPWKLQSEDSGHWTTIAWPDKFPGVLTGGQKIQDESHPVTLQPRENALFEIQGDFEKQLRPAQHFRVILAQAGAGPIQNWSGKLEMPTAPVRVQPGAARDANGDIPLPKYIPPLVSTPMSAWLGNGSGNESKLYYLLPLNRALLDQLTIYDAPSVAREFERRLAAEKNFHLQLLLASEAAACGSTAGKTFILDALKQTDYENVLSFFDALRFFPSEAGDPDWVCDAMIAALADQRHITNIPRSCDSRTVFTVSYLADEFADLPYVLGDAKCRKAVPVLIDLVKHSDHRRNAAFALGEIGDPAAIPALADLVKKAQPDLKIGSGMLPDDYRNALRSLVALKAPGIADLLLKQVGHQEIVAMLEDLADPRAIPILKQIVATGKPYKIEGADPESDRWTVDAARVALATLEPGDPIPRYCALVQDQSLNEFTRREAVWRLRDPKHIDPRAIPVLLKAVREDPSGTVVDNAIGTLGDYKYKAAVDGLIDCLSADFGGKDNWKYAYKPDMFRDHIAAALANITGEDFGPNAAAWKSWWTTKGSIPSTLP